MLFKYRGFDINGDMVSGYINADTKKAALFMLKKEKNMIALVYINRKVDHPTINKVRANMDENKKKAIEKSASRKQRKKESELKRREEIRSGEYEPFSIKKKINEVKNKMMNTVNRDTLSGGSGVLGGTNIIYIQSPDELDRYQPVQSERDDVVITRVAGGKRKNINEGKVVDLNNLMPDEMTPEMKKNSRIRVKERDIILFTKKLNMMLGSGVSLIRALTVLKNTSPKPLMKVLDGVIETIQKGSPFSIALTNYPRQFDSIYVSLVSIGESSGNLVKSLNDIVYYKEKNSKVKKKLKTAAIYPSIIGFILGLLLIFGSVYFIPMFEDMFTDQGIELPWLTQFVFSLANKIPLFMFLIFLVVFGIVFLRKTNRAFDTVFRQFFDLLVFKIPIFNKIISSNYMFAFSSSTALMLENGIRLKDALVLTKRAIKNVYIKSEINSASDLMVSGYSFSESISKQPHFDELLISILITGEESGRMSESLREISLYYDDEVNRRVGNMMEIVQPAFIFVIALIVLPVIIAVYLPILDISSGAGLGL